MNRKWIALSLVIGTIATTGFAKDVSPVLVTTSNMNTSASTIGSDQEYRLRQGDELMIDVVQQADLGVMPVMAITQICLSCAKIFLLTILSGSFPFWIISKMPSR